MQTTLDQLFNEAKQRMLARPDDVVARSTLWQVLAARGEYERAHSQLDALVAIDSSWSMEAASCQGLLLAERTRQQVFAGQLAPTCLGEPPPWFADLAAGLKLLSDPARCAEAAGLLHRAQQASGVMPGRLNEQPFDWLCDGDARLGPCLELVVRGRYLWVPWARVSRIVSRAPTEIRDRLWLHVQIEFGDNGGIEGFLPSRYPDAQTDDQRLGRMTDWTPIADELFVGRGQKTLLTNVDQHGLLDVRELVFAGTSP